MKADSIKTELYKDFFQLCQRVARSAGAVIKRGAGRGLRIEFKRARDMVTQVDREAERVAIQIIHNTYPSHTIITEEKGLIGLADAEYVWYLDPLDGTTNFVHGFPVYGISVAIAHGSDLLAAAIYDPTRDELFSAYHGGGAFLNGRPIQVSSIPDLEHSLVATGFYYEHDELFQLNMTIWNEVYKKTQGLRRAGAAAIDLAYVAAGRLDGFWEFSLQPWDMAAGALLVLEAGGVVTHIDGSPFDIRYSHQRHIMAANPHLHRELQASIGQFLTTD